MGSTLRYFIIVSQVTSLATVMAGEIAQALMDGVLDGTELANIIKRLIMNLRMVGVSHAQLDQIKMVMTRPDFEALPFKDGDIVVYVPSELTDQLKIEVT